MTKYNEKMAKAGILLDLAGLQPSSKGERIKFSGGRPTVVDGPFPETKELIAGYRLIRVKSKEEAIDWAKRCPAPHGEAVQARSSFANCSSSMISVRARRSRTHEGSRANWRRKSNQP